MKQRGVTLIQMLSALAVAVLLTQLGIPAYATMSDDLHRAAAARDLAQALRSARSHAMLQTQPVLVQALDGNWGNGWRVVLEHNQQVLREHRLSRPMKITANTGGEVKFSALGVPMQPNNAQMSGRLVVCDKPTSPYRVFMASTGRIDLRKDNPNDPLCAGS
ncbi:GspH/FimT family pseudopilin [Pseudomonas sp. NBRC 111133]|uniref:GspH/FimT family pseudopilin n=1 Tax=Pseudomonas sp. NBRC 111133 TaxID=1661048 RepID=UPI000761098D|nr:GspH/FimT family pseudopilin [Pseudomonas sp. NBRC 111133]